MSKFLTLYLDFSFAQDKHNLTEAAVRDLQMHASCAAVQAVRDYLEEYDCGRLDRVTVSSHYSYNRSHQLGPAAFTPDELSRECDIRSPDDDF